MKYCICAYSDNVEPFSIPRQLEVINGETLLARTVRLLKQNGVDEIYITSADERFEVDGATRIVPKDNDYKPRENKGYWLSAFPYELMDSPVTFLFGDVYYSEKAMETIVRIETGSVLFFCSYNNKDPRYIKHHSEPFAFKVVDTTLFKYHIERVKRMFDYGQTRRHPIAWELYRSINGIDVNTHALTENYVVINDETADIDTPADLEKLKKIRG